MTDDEIAIHRDYWKNLVRTRRKERLSTVLEKLPAACKQNPRNRHLEDWVRKATHLSGEELDQWYARAWYGCLAGRLVAHRIRKARYDEVIELCDEPDFGLLNSLAAEGQGVFLVGCHLGPTQLARLMLVNANFDVLYLSAGRRSQFRSHDAGRVIRVDETGKRSHSVLEVLTRLRDGGITYAAADGRRSARAVTTTFMNHRIMLGTGIPRLIKASRSPSIATAAYWKGNGRIGLSLRRLPDFEPEANDWQTSWLHAYQTWMEELIETPENLRLVDGYTFLGLRPILLEDESE